MAEFIHKQVSGEGDFDREFGLEKSPASEATAEDLRENSTENAKDGKGNATNSIGQSAEGHVMKVGAEMVTEEEDELGMIEDGDGIIKAGGSDDQSRLNWKYYVTI